MDWAKTGFAAHMLPLRPGASAEERQRRSRNMLLRALDMRTAIAVVGAGCSKPLGYPLWPEFASELLEQAYGTLEPASSEAKRLASYREAIVERKEKRQDLIMFYLGACQEALDLHKKRTGGKEDLYKDYIQRRFKGPGIEVDVKPKVPDPYRQLVDLPIQRFVTTNYDCEIERALRQHARVPASAFGLEERPVEPQHGASQKLRLSFHQEARYFNELAVFSLANVRENRNMVFHCHGRYDDVESIVASERDYQKWYLGKDRDPAATGFRQSVEMLLASNPLLFVGYGLGDDDLLRPLRHLVAANPNRKPSHPIFALLEIEDEATDPHRYAMLYERYGLHVLPYACKRGESRATALCRELTELKEDWQEARQEWLRKPKVRKPISQHKRPATYRDIDRTPLPLSPLKKLKEEILAGGILGLRSPSGDGKTIQCLSLIEDPDVKEKFPDGIFYWNFHYGSELLTVVDTLLAYLEDDQPYDLCAGRERRLKRHLKNGRYLIVLDACERLLHKGNDGAEPIPYSVLFAQVLRAFRHKKSQSTVVLAGRILPRLKEMRIVSAQPITSEALKGYTYYPQLARLRDDDRVTLCTILKGHNFALMLAAQHLEEIPDEKLGKDFQELVSQLSERTQDQRLREMILLRLGRFDQASDGLATSFLRHLALFLTPVCEETLAICYAEAVRRAKPPNDKSFDWLCKQFLDAHFLFKATPRRDDTTAYCVHATVRSQFLRSFHGQSSDALPDFGLSGFLSGRVGVDPGPQSHQEILGLFHSLEEAIIQALEENKKQRALNLCRDTLSLLRSRMEANTAARWSLCYDEYARMGIRTALLAKRLSPGSWTYREHSHADEAMNPDAPIYLGELAWLYNDVALALSAMGQLRDAYSVWEQTYEIGRLVEPPENGSGLQVESLLSLALCFIEMGRLPAARKVLDETPDRKRLSRDVNARLLGLQALLQHLHGNLPKADAMYKRCLRHLARSQNLRALSYFSKQRADLKIALRDLGKAKVLIRASRAIAEGGVFPDLVLLARVTEGHIETHEQRHDRARDAYNAVLSEAERLGLRKLEAESYLCLARVALLEKDHDGARQLGIKSLRIANELGLGLRITHSLVVLGLAMLNEHRHLGVAYLRHAKRLADEQEYWHRGWEAGRKLQELGEQP